MHGLWHLYKSTTIEVKSVPGRMLSHAYIKYASKFGAAKVCSAPEQVFYKATVFTLQRTNSCDTVTIGNDKLARAHTCYCHNLSIEGLLLLLTSLFVCTKCIYRYIPT